MRFMMIASRRPARNHAVRPAHNNPGRHPDCILATCKASGT
jgi:hypothetical protein